MIGIEKFTQNLSLWLRTNNYVGYDPYQLQLMKLWPILNIMTSPRLPNFFLNKSLMPRLYDLAIKQNKKLLIPKALGLIIRGNISMFKKTKKISLLSQNETLIQMLIDNRYPSYSNPSWGVPFSWKSGFGLFYPEGYPAAIVATEVGHAFLDHYEIKPSRELKMTCRGIAEALIKETGFTQIDGQRVCFHYTDLDKYFVVNVNTYAASYLARLHSIIPDKKYHELALAAIKFTLSQQRDDGSWYYYAPPFVQTNKLIDNRHTGFTLVSLLWTNKILNRKDIAKAVQKGWQFYRQNFISDFNPKWSMDSLFPIDMHNVAQLIITAAEFDDLELAQGCAQWAIDNMSNNKDEFYYRMYQNGTIIRIPFIRWNQAWMYRAIALLLEKKGLGIN
ncbi:MAG: hypothetical protein JXB43_05960 [Dehalococcoidia bacterium]|nr:hypothetical protein [Dehalococcoidia bacterium]